MTTENENQGIDINDEAVVAVIEGDEHLRTLPLDSEDLRAAVADKMSASKTVEDDTSADVDGNEDEEDAEDSEKDDSQEGVKKPQKGWAKRVGKLVAQNREKDARIRELESKVQQTAQPQVEAFEYDKPEPVFDDFNTIGEYSKAVARWEYGRLKAEEAYQSEVETTTKNFHEAQTSWEAKEADARSQYADYDDIVTGDSVEAANPSQMAKEFLAKFENAPVIVYTILADPDLTEEFAEASPATQKRMLAKVAKSLNGDAEAHSEQKQVATTKKAVKLPTPLPKGRPTSQSFDLVRDADRMSDDEWNRAFEAQRRK